MPSGREPVEKPVEEPVEEQVGEQVEEQVEERVIEFVAVLVQSKPTLQVCLLRCSQAPSSLYLSPPFTFPDATDISRMTKIEVFRAEDYSISASVGEVFVLDGHAEV